MWLGLILSLLCHVPGQNFRVFSILRYSSLHFIHYSHIRDSFIILVISIEEGHIWRPSILSSWHVMSKSALIHLLLLVYDLMVIFWVIFKLFSVVHYNSFGHYLWIFFRDIERTFWRSLVWWLVTSSFFSLGLCLAWFWLVFFSTFEFRFVFTLHGFRVRWVLQCFIYLFISWLQWLTFFMFDYTWLIFWF